MNPSKDQATGIVERLGYGLILGVMMKLVQRGYIDADMAAYLAGGVVAAVGGIWAWWTNRPKALLQAAANVPNPDSPSGRTIIVASAALAKDTPGESNIVSSDTSKVVTK